MADLRISLKRFTKGMMVFGIYFWFLSPFSQAMSIINEYYKFISSVKLFIAAGFRCLKGSFFFHASLEGKTTQLLGKFVNLFHRLNYLIL